MVSLRNWLFYLSRLARNPRINCEKVRGDITTGAPPPRWPHHRRQEIDDELLVRMKHHHGRAEDAATDAFRHPGRDRSVLHLLAVWTTAGIRPGGRRRGSGRVRIRYSCLLLSGSWLTLCLSESGRTAARRWQYTQPRLRLSHPTRSVYVQSCRSSMR